MKQNSSQINIRILQTINDTVNALFMKFNEYFFSIFCVHIVLYFGLNLRREEKKNGQKK